MLRKFAHRTNQNHTADSICTTCFVTIATSSQESELAQFEQDHVCDPSLIAERISWNRPPYVDLMWAGSK
jgi:hypothetical protein